MDIRQSNERSETGKKVINKSTKNPIQLYKLPITLDQYLAVALLSPLTLFHLKVLCFIIVYMSREKIRKNRCI